jgi:capsule biosynthesis phosphatase
MRIVIDLDGTLCPIKGKGERYEDLKPLDNAVSKVKELRQAGHYIIIQTARNMATQQGNLGKVMQNVGKITLDWLEKYEIPYDEIFFGKPNAHLYIDDRAFRFSSWNDVTPDMVEQLGKEQ